MNSHQVPGKAESYWLATSPDTGYPSLQQELTVDVAIVGGGFVGIVSGFFLKEAGLNVAVLEGSQIVKGVTGHTTAKVTSLHGLIYEKIIREYGIEKASQYAASNQGAIEKIASLVESRNISCDFSRLPFCIYTQRDEAVRQIEGEVSSARTVGLPASFLEEVPLPFKTKGAIQVANQAQFHPRKFLLALAASIPGKGSHIFENTRVHDIEYGDTCVLLANQGKLLAKNVIIATNFPIFDKGGLYFARLQPQLSYALAVRIGDRFPHGMFFTEDEKGYGWRIQPDQNGEVLVLSGASHIPGRENDTTKFYKKLEAMVKQAYPNSSIEYSWSTQDNISYDGVPYIGKLSPLHSNVFVATGFNEWGMTTSVVAGTILADLVQGKKNQWAEVYDPLRFKANASSAKKLVSQNTENIKIFIGERLFGKPTVPEIAPGEGKVIEDRGQKRAVYKDEQGNTFKLNPNCRHMGCLVHWNNAEKTWDCPCHGSRYSSTGEVFHAPAVRGLAD